MIESRAGKVGMQHAGLASREPCDWTNSSLAIHVYHGLPAAPLAADAERSVGVDDHVAGVHRQAPGATVRESVGNHCGLDAGPHIRADADVNKVGDALSAAAENLGHRRGPGLVLDDDRQRKPLLEELLESQRLPTE